MNRNKEVKYNQFGEVAKIMDEYGELYIVKAPFSSEGGQASPLMRKIGKGKIALLAWRTKEAAEAFAKRYERKDSDSYCVCLESVEYVERLRKGFEDKGYAMSLEFSD